MRVALLPAGCMDLDTGGHGKYNTVGDEHGRTGCKALWRPMEGGFPTTHLAPSFAAHPFTGTVPTPAHSTATTRQMGAG